MPDHEQVVPLVALDATDRLMLGLADVKRYEIALDSVRLSINTPFERRMLAVGCPLFAVAVLSMSALGILGILQEARSINMVHSSDAAYLFNPHANQFLFLWLVALLFTAVFIPVYVVIARRYTTPLCMDRGKGVLLRYGKPVTWLSRVEAIRLRKSEDQDRFAIYRVSVMYNDGHNLLVDHTESAYESEQLAQLLAEFVGVPIAYSAGGTGGRYE